MPEAQITKQAMAAAMKHLMEQKPLAKISVRDITEACGMNRQTFYYHFRDKYELMNWIYYTEVLPYMGNFTDISHWTNGVSALCCYMQENRRFYINALSTSGQNSFPEYLTDFLHRLIRSLIDELRGERILPEEEMEFIADFYAYAFVGLLQKWASHGMAEDPRQYIQHIQDLVDGSMLRELAKFDKTIQESWNIHNK